MSSADQVHDCPCGCGAQLPRHLLACRNGWSRLPFDLRLKINSAWRRRKAGRPGARAAHIDLIQQAVEWYEAEKT